MKYLKKFENKNDDEMVERIDEIFLSSFEESFLDDTEFWFKYDDKKIKKYTNEYKIEIGDGTDIIDLDKFNKYYLIFERRLKKVTGLNCQYEPFYVNIEGLYIHSKGKKVGKTARSIEIIIK